MRSPQLSRRALSLAAFFVLGALGLAAPPAGAEIRAATAITAVDARRGDSETVVEIAADGPIGVFEHFRIEEPPRLVIDFPGLASALPRDRVDVGGQAVRRVRIGQHGDKVRVVLDVADGSLAGARVERESGGVAVRLPVPESAAASAPALPPVSAGGAPPPPPAARRQPAGGEAALELNRAALELAAAARDLSAAARELEARVRRESRSSDSLPPVASEPSPAPPAPVAAAVPPETGGEANRAAPRPAEPEAPEPAPPSESGASATAPAATAALATAARAATASSAVDPPPVSSRPRGAPAPLADTPYALTHAGAVEWLERHRDTAPGFEPGEVLGRGDLDRLRPFLPPGYFDEFDFADVRVAIQETGDHAPHRSYQEASFRYRGQASIAPDGSIENYTAGRPFSDEQIVAAPPRDAGFMVGWNNIYRWQHYGYRAAPIPMVYMAPGDGEAHAPEHAGVLRGGGQAERVLVTEYQRVYLSHQAALADQGYRVDVADAKEQHFKDWMQFTEPFDMRGMAFVFERFRDPHEPDQVNSYLPTERRIRRLSAKERSDSFVGSEMTMDDFEGFSGRMLDYAWEYRGTKHVLHVADSGQPHSVFFGPQSQIPDDRWQLRRCHVVETRPLYEGHPYGRKLTFYDAQTYNVAATVVFDRDDRLYKVIYTIYKWPGGSPDGDPADTVSHWRSSVAINKQNQRTMVSWSEGTEIPDMKASVVRRLFSVSSLTGGR